MTTKPLPGIVRALPAGLGNIEYDVFATPLLSLSSLEQLKHDVSLPEIHLIVMLPFVPLFSAWYPSLPSPPNGRVAIDLERHHIHRALQ